MPDLPKKKEPKNPARVDAALKTHLRRMESSVRTLAVVVVLMAMAFVLLVTFQPMRPKFTGAGATCSVVVLLGALIGLLDAESRRRATRGKLMRTCRGCGYDLRATPDLCPECGTPIPEELRAAREAGKDKLYMPESPAE